MSNKKKDNKKKTLLISSILGIVLIAAIVCVIIFMQKNNDKGGSGSGSGTEASATQAESGGTKVGTTEAVKTEAPTTEVVTTEEVTEKPKPDQSLVNQLMLDIVCSNLYGMRSYSWQKYPQVADTALNKDSAPVAIGDFNQDEVTDIIFLASGDGDYSDKAKLYIFGYQNGQPLLLYSEGPFDVQAGGGTRYTFFKDASGCLYLYFSAGDENWDYTWYRFDPDKDGILTKTVVAHQSKKTDGSTFDGEDVKDEASYNAAVDGLIKKMDQLVLFNYIDNEKLLDAAQKVRDISYSADDLIRYLEGIITY